MASVFSQSFITQHAGTSSSSTAVVPAGYVFVVKQISIYVSTLGGATVFFKQKTINAVYREHTVGPFGKISVAELVTFCFNEGESFGFELNAVDPTDRMDVYAGGYALTLP